MKRTIVLTSALFLIAAALAQEKTGVREQPRPESGMVAAVSQPQPTPPLPASFELPKASWIPQTFNNCGPAATSMLLQYFGYTVSQQETKQNLRSGEDDTNVFLYEIADYIAKEYNLEAKIFINGDIPTLKALIANGFYIVVEDWLHPNEDIGHVLIIRGYDDQQGVLIADDSYLGVGKTYPYAEFDLTQWKPFNREFMPVYRTEKEPLLERIIGETWNPTIMHEHAVSKAKEEIAANAQDMYAYFNLGTSFFGLKQYREAHLAFTTSQSLGWPKRMLWYQIQPVIAANELGLYTEAIALADVGLWENESFAELHVEKAKSYKGLGDRTLAKKEIDRALEIAPNLVAAKTILASL